MPEKDWFTEGFGAAIGDIRRRLVEEAWFGKPVTAPAHCAKPSLAESLGWAIDGTPDRQSESDRDASRDRSHGMDR